jgi:ABC-type uncharacterized transport system permease subunit
MTPETIWAVVVAVLGGAIRVGTPFLFVSLGECLTEKSGRINLGLEGVLVFSAMSAFGVSWLTGSAWMGVAAAALSGAALAMLHGLLCSLPRVNDLAMGIAVMMLGLGLAFFLGKPLIQPQAPVLAPLALGTWSESPAIRAALEINPLFPIGLLIAAAMTWALARSRWGLTVRLVGDSADAARAMGVPLHGTRILATTLGGAIAGLGGACLSLYYPGSWNESLSSGQGLIAVALVIFARWRPMACLGAAMLFGGAGALGPALQSVGVTGYTYLFNAVPYALTLAILVVTCSPDRSLRGAPGELVLQR